MPYGELHVEFYNHLILAHFFFAQDGLMQEEMSTFHDEVFESPSDSTSKDMDSKQLDESELTGSALDKNELERSHLMLWVCIHYLSLVWIKQTMTQMIQIVIA